MGKWINKELISAESTGIECIDWQECEILSQLNHKNIVKFMGVSFPDDCPFPVLVMERLVGNLHDLLLTIPNILLALKTSILADVANGLLYLHQFNPQIVHRDLTAKNVLLTASLEAKIADIANNRIIKLPLAQNLPENSGMLLYMPPEASKSSSHYSPSFDIFSFGHLALFVGLQVSSKYNIE